MQIRADFSSWNKGTWTHYSNFDALKINAKPFHQDPAGIYFFPKGFDTIGSWHTYKYKFIAKLKPEAKVLDFEGKSAAFWIDLIERGGAKSENADRWKSFCDELAEETEAGRQAMSFLRSHFIRNNAAFNAFFRKLGYDALFDDTKAIHSAEVQLVVLNPRMIEVVERVDRNDNSFKLLESLLRACSAAVSHLGDVKVTEPRMVSSWGEKGMQARLNVDKKPHSVSWSLNSSTIPVPGSKQRALDGISVYLNYSSGPQRNYSIALTEPLRNYSEKKLVDFVVKETEKVFAAEVVSFTARVKRRYVVASEQAYVEILDAKGQEGAL